MKIYQSISSISKFNNNLVSLLSLSLNVSVDPPFSNLSELLESKHDISLSPHCIKSGKRVMEEDFIDLICNEQLVGEFV